MSNFKNAQRNRWFSEANRVKVYTNSIRRFGTTPLSINQIPKTEVLRDREVYIMGKNGEKMEPDIYDVPNDIDNGVAKIALESQGIILDELSDEQNQYRKNWKEGT